MKGNGLIINHYGNKYKQRRVAKDCLEIEKQDLDDFDDIMKDFHEQAREINKLKVIYTEQDPLSKYFVKASKKEKEIKTLHQKINLGEDDIEYPKVVLCIKLNEYDILYNKIKGGGC